MSPRLPPTWFRRVVLAPAVVALAAVLVWTIPLYLLAIVALGLIPKVGRAVRVLGVLVIYLVLEGALLVSLLGLWIISGFGWRIHSPWFRAAHYRLTAWILRVLFTYVDWSLRLSIRYYGDFGTTQGHGDRPQVLASRHAGPGDSFTLIHSLLNAFHRNPRIVLKDTLQWDPAIDVLMNRLSMVFLQPTSFTDSRNPQRGARSVDRIAAMSAAMEDRDTLIVFPEGCNFTQGRRLARIKQLTEDGHDDHAEMAAGMTNVLAPRPGGLVAAIDAQPDAGVVFVAHTGLDKFESLGEIWKALPIEKTLHVKGWYVPPEDIPATYTDRVDWLYHWWRKIDAWIDADLR
ncbi:MAG: 1-acyl-sn-glycerol-3-phosphate acyltransferase [Candidatus Corynebacterium faecigallinarum]